MKQTRQVAKGILTVEHCIHLCWLQNKEHPTNGSLVFCLTWITPDSWGEADAHQHLSQYCYLRSKLRFAKVCTVLDGFVNESITVSGVFDLWWNLKWPGFQRKKVYLWIYSRTHNFSFSKTQKYLSIFSKLILSSTSFCFTELDNNVLRLNLGCVNIFCAEWGY